MKNIVLYNYLNFRPIILKKPLKKEIIGDYSSFVTIIILFEIPAFSYSEVIICLPGISFEKLKYSRQIMIII